MKKLFKVCNKCGAPIAEDKELCEDCTIELEIEKFEKDIET